MATKLGRVLTFGEYVQSANAQLVTYLFRSTFSFVALYSKTLSFFRFSLLFVIFCFFLVLL